MRRSAGAVYEPHKAIGLVSLLLLMTLSACGGGGGGSGGDGDAAADSGGSADSGSDNETPIVLSGTPVPTVASGAQFRFRPNVNDTLDGMTFTVTNLPSWASFDSANGEISGTPAPADVGVYAGIVVSVSDGNRSASMDAFSVEVVAIALGSARLTWIAPTENSDGSPLTDLAGFKVYWGSASDELIFSTQIDNPSVSDFLVENLTPSQWFFAVTAIDSTGNESTLSEVISGQIS